MVAEMVSMRADLSASSWAGLWVASMVDEMAVMSVVEWVVRRVVY